MSAELALLSATEVVARYADGNVSPVEVTESTLAQIERHDATVNAYCLVDADRARHAARSSEARWRRGEPAGALDGVPVAVKDVFLTEGWPCLRGSHTVDAAGPWTEDAPAVAALRHAGAVLVGKTTTPELGWKGVTDSPRHGVTRNPWDPTRTAGGSSGGSAAALVLGMATLALGTDGGGSIRIPASFCGLPGLKPTYGRVPLWPPSPYGELAHAGPMARSVAELALLLDVISRPDPRDPTALPAVAAHQKGDLDGGVAGLRLAYWPGPTGLVEPEVGRLVTAAAGAFAKLGAIVEEVDPGVGDAGAIYETLWFAGAAAATRHLGAEALEEMDPGLVAAIADFRGLSALDYLDALRRRDELRVAMGAFHQHWDLLLTPTVAVAAFEAGRNVPAGWPDHRWPTWTPFTYPFNLTQQPAATLACGFTAAGLPVGLQIVGPRHADTLVLRAASAYEARHPLGCRPAMLDDVPPERN